MVNSFSFSSLFKSLISLSSSKIELINSNSFFTWPQPWLGLWTVSILGRLPQQMGTEQSKLTGLSFNPIDLKQEFARFHCVCVVGCVHIYDLSAWYGFQLGLQTFRDYCMIPGKKANAFTLSSFSLLKCFEPVLGFVYDNWQMLIQFWKLRFLQAM